MRRSRLGCGAPTDFSLPAAGRIRGWRRDSSSLCRPYPTAPCARHRLSWIEFAGSDKGARLSLTRSTTNSAGLVWLAFARRLEPQRDLHRRSDQVSESLPFRPLPASRSSPQGHRQTRARSGDVIGCAAPGGYSTVSIKPSLPGRSARSFDRTGVTFASSGASLGSSVKDISQTSNKTDFAIVINQPFV